MSTPTYNFTDDPVPQSRNRRSGRNRGSSSRSGSGSNHHHGQHTRIVMEGDSNLTNHFSQQGDKLDVDNTDGNGSLTYSASSSIHSHSTAGESTDSSFSGIMKVLDLDDDAELDRLISKGDEVLTAQQQQQLLLQHSQQQQRERREQSHNGHGHGRRRSEDSSLQYSTDYTDDTTTSPLAFTLTTGQPSDSHAHDGGGFGTNEQGIVFAPANPTSSRSTKSSRNKKRLEKLEKINSSNSSVASSNSNSKASKRGQNQPASSGNRVSGTRLNSAARTRSDPGMGQRGLRAESRGRSIDSDPRKVLDAFANSSSPPPRGASRALDKERPQQLWYKQWWMCGFTDALNFQEP